MTTWRSRHRAVGQRRGIMNLIRLYIRVLGLLGPDRRLGWILAVANVALAAAQFAEPVLFGKVIDTLTGAQARGQAPFWGDLLTLLGAWAVFGTVHHRGRYAGGAACRPPVAPAAPRRADRLFRARAAVAAIVPRLDPFGTAPEGHADRHRRAVGALARVLPRAPRRLRVADRPVAAVAVPQLAARARCSSGCASSSPA